MAHVREERALESAGFVKCPLLHLQFEILLAEFLLRLGGQFLLLCFQFKILTFQFLGEFQDLPEGEGSIKSGGHHAQDLVHELGRRRRVGPKAGERDETDDRRLRKDRDGQDFAGMKIAAGGGEGEPCVRRDIGTALGLPRGERQAKFAFPARGRK